MLTPKLEKLRKIWIPNKINWRSRDQIEVNISSTLTNFQLSATTFVLKILLVSVSLQCEGDQTSLYYLQKFCLGKKRRRLALSHRAVKIYLVLMKNTPSKNLLQSSIKGSLRTFCEREAAEKSSGNQLRLSVKSQGQKSFEVSGQTDENLTNSENPKKKGVSVSSHTKWYNYLHYSRQLFQAIKGITPQSVTHLTNLWEGWTFIDALTPGGKSHRKSPGLLW